MFGRYRRSFTFTTIMLAAAMGGTLSASPANAQWPTTQFVPVPSQHSMAVNVQSDFALYSSGVPATIEIKGNKAIAVDTLDLGKLRNGAAGAMTDIMRLVEINAMKMQNAGFTAPDIEPLLFAKTPKKFYYPIFWQQNVESHYSFVWGGCYPQTYHYFFSSIANPLRYYILADDSRKTTYKHLAAAYKAGGDRRRRMLLFMSSQLTHEIVHGIQNASTTKHDTNGVCRSDPLWWKEGTADAVAYFLTALRFPEIYKKYGLMRNPRRYDLSLDLRQNYRPTPGVDFNYGTGSFFRYLIEAAGPSAEQRVKNGLNANIDDNMALAKGLVSIPPAGSDNKPYIKFISNIIAKHSGGRTLYQVFPEFLTEYASYGQRYKVGQTEWIKKAFHGCKKIGISPGQQADVTLVVNGLAGKCIKLHYGIFTVPVALQMYATGVPGGGGHVAALHLGQALQVGDVVKGPLRDADNCYAVTKHIDHRLKHWMNEKCILKRDMEKISAGNGKAQLAAFWTSDFNAFGRGDAYFVLSNVSDPAASSKRQTVKFHVGAIRIKETEGKKITPQKPHGATRPVEHGMTDMKKRVYALTVPGGKALFDGRDMVSAAQQKQVKQLVRKGGEKASVALVFAKPYWVMFSWPKPGTDVARHGDLGMVMKNPRQSAGGMGIISMPGASHFDKGGKCGYETPAKVTVVEKSKQRLAFHISGDLFDFSRMMGVDPGASGCNAFRQAWVEHASFEVALPNGQLYGPHTVVTSAHPPGQAVYDKEFLPGPNFGGIATSRSLLEEGPPHDNPWRNDGPPPKKQTPTPSGPGTDGTSGMDAMQGGFGAQMSQMSNKVCKMLTQQQDMSQIPKRVVPMIMQSIKGMHCTCDMAKAMNDPARKGDFSPALIRAVKAQAGQCEP